MFQGVIYIATGPRYVEEVLKSVASLKTVVPSVHVTLFSDEQISSPYFNNHVLIDGRKQPDEKLVKGRSHKGRLNKLYYMSKSPYERTLFLDTDTYVASDISDMFSLLDRFDIALVHAPHRIPLHMKPPLLTEIPRSFAVLNTGVVLFKRSAEMQAFFSEWLRLFQDVKYKGYTDQSSFRVALYRSDLRIATLPPEYNYRFRKRLCINGSLKILHGRHPNLNIIAKRVNAIVTRGITRALVPSVWLAVLKRVTGPFRH